MEVVFLMVALVSAVSSLKCRTSVDLAIRWTVDCSAMNFSSAPPSMIIHPVVGLNMSHNSLMELEESQFINWTDISVLDLSANNIQMIGANSFKGLSNLTELYLNHNAIQVLSSNVTNHLIKLRILSISFNMLKSIDSSAFDSVPLLYKLYLGHNLDLGKIPENLTPLKMALSKSLLTLGVEDISLSNIPKDLFSEATHLLNLNLALNPLKNVSDLPLSLRYLNISGTLIETISNYSFSNLQLLQKISLESIPTLREIKGNSFSDLRNVEEVYVRNCSKLSFISETAFSESHTKLRKVVLSQCAFASLPRTFKPVLGNLEYLDLQENPWTCDSSTSWMLNMNLGNLTSELRCENPPAAKGILMVDYFKPRTLHPHTSLIRAAIFVMLVAVLVASVVAMVKQMSKQKAKTYRQLDIKLEDRTPRVLPPL